jgi:short-subunit dehydrogenase
MQKTVLVTGGSKGIGLAIVEKFLENDFRVISLSRTEGQLVDLKNKFPRSLDIQLLDLSSKTAVKLFVQKAIDDKILIDVLVNNAGIFIPGQIGTESDEDFELQMSLNLGSAYFLSKGLFSSMNKEAGAMIFNICSTASKVAYVNGGAYCISKHAMLGMSKVMREELKGKGILVCSVMPGATKTDSWSGTDLPDSRFVMPSNIADVVWTAWTIKDNCVMEEVVLRPILGDII